MEKKEILVQIDTPSVKKFIFGNNSLKGMRGGSSILEKLNVEKTEDLLSEHKAEKFYLGGGGGLALFPSQETFQNFQKKLRDAYFEKTGTFGVQFSSILFDRKANFKKQKKQLSEKLSLQPPAFQNPIAPFPASRLCQFCHQFPVEYKIKITDEIDEEEKSICSICMRKNEEGKRANAKKLNSFCKLKEYYNKEREKVKKERVNWQLMENFEEIGSFCKTKRGYLALIYADGNQMSLALDRLIEQDSSLKKIKSEYNQFSHNLDQALRKATNQAIYETHPDGISDKNQSTFASEILLLGGDDLLLACPADQALQISLKLIQGFEEDGFIKKSEMSLSIGVAIAKHNTPVLHLVELAEQLLKSAKQKSFIIEKEKLQEQKEQEEQEEQGQSQTN